MRFFFSLLLFFSCILSINGYDASVCTGLHINLATFVPSGFQYVFKYSADLILSASDKSHTILTFSNQSTWSLDENKYYQSDSIQFLNDIEVVKCSESSGSCTMKIYDSLGLLQIPLSLNGVHKSPTLNENLFFDQGSVFNIDLSMYDSKLSYFDKVSPCKLSGASAKFSERRSFISPYFAPMGLDYTSTVEFCCNKFYDFTVPDTTSSCQKFDGNTIVTDSSNNLIADLSYYLQMEGVSANINFLANKMPGNSRLMVTLNDNAIFDGSMGLCDYYSQESQICSTSIKFTQIVDYQANLQFRILSKDFSFPPYGPIIAAKFIQRNGIWFKNQNQLYTSSDPCWNRTTRTSNALTAKNSLCCTSLDSSNPGCVSYTSTTGYSVNGGNIGLQVNYQFFDKSFFILTIVSYYAPQASTVTVSSYSHDISTQSCQSATSAPSKSCVFKLSKLNSYDIKFTTSINSVQNGIVTITVGANSQVISPNVSPNNQCIEFGAFGNSTNFCCLT